MWKWTEILDEAFTPTTYRVKVDGYIIASMKHVGGEWIWELQFPLLRMPEGCSGLAATKDEARQAIERRFNELTAGMTKEAAFDRMMKGVIRSRP